ncbi:hypothetical protein B0H11DRAFT_2252245 [Mycena galericulata]|nr:hypothetical protein B0H11DRAFT_2252245 [Mycena galericulata]
MARDLVRATVLPRADYGVSSFFPPPASALKPLERINKSAAKCITGGYQTTSGAALEKEAAILPVPLRLESALLHRLARYLTLPPTHDVVPLLQGAICIPPKHAHRASSLHYVERVPVVRWPIGVPARGQRLRCRKTPYILPDTAPLDPDLTLGMEHILPRFLSDPGFARTTWFTDGSLLNGAAGGAAVRIEEGAVREKILIPLGDGQVAEGEVEGVLRATEKVMGDGECRMLTVSDSQAGLRGITSTAPRSGQFRAIEYDVPILNAACIPDIQDLTTEELIRIVKRLGTGPSSWGAAPAPNISKEIIIQATMRGGKHDYHHAKLLPSGRHVLFHNYQALECWDVAQDRLVWKRTPLVEGAELVGFAAEENAGGGRLTILICESGRAGKHPADFVKVLDLNLSTGTHDDLLITSSPRVHDSDDPFGTDPSISGSICVVRPEPMGGYLVLDWKTKSSFVLNCGPFSQINLVPGHLIVVVNNQLQIISCEALNPYWSPAIGIGIGDLKSVFIDKIPRLTLEAPKGITEGFYIASIPVDPLRDHAYRMWTIGRRGFRDQELWRYDLLLRPGHPPRHRGPPLLTSTLLPHDIIGLTYSGHSLSYADEDYDSDILYRICSPTATSDFVYVELPDCISAFVDIAAYSGAIIYPTGRSIVIRYYI